MKSWLLPMIGLTLILVLAAGCGTAAPTPTSTSTPSPTATPTPTGLATPTPPLPGSDQDPSVLPKGPDGSTVPAPIESVEIERLAAKPPNATLIVVSGLPSGCKSFGGYSLTREGDVFNLEVTNRKRDLDCPATYTTVRTDIPLGQPGYSDIEPCKTYTVVVNGETRSVKSSCPAIPSGQFSEPTATPTPLPTATPTPTPSPAREWNLEGVQVDGSTVIVRLHVFAGIDVRATLDGRDPDQVNAPIPSLEFVFQDVTPGQHTIEVRDVVGFKESAEVVVPSPTSVKEPIDSLCIPAAPLGVSVGDTWTLVGTLRGEGDFSESGFPEGTSEVAGSYTVTAIEDSNWSVGEATPGARGKNVVFVKHSKVKVSSKQVGRDANGNVLGTQEEVLDRATIQVANLGPVLTLDWDCHRQAWLQRQTSGNLPGGGTTNAEYSVEEKTLSSGITAVLFLQTLRLSHPEQDTEVTGEIVIGYDKLTGRLVLLEARGSGTRSGEQFNSVIVQELVPEGTVINENGDRDQVEPQRWLTDLIWKLEHEPVANPPLSITQYSYKGQTVYFVPQRCCDIFSDLYDADGNIIGHPDGGITGMGDGRVPDFFDERKNEQVIWKDQRTNDTHLTQVSAPIESVEILIMESFPPQYAVVVVSGLPNACVTFGGHRLEREDDTIRIEMLNWKPADSEVVCAQVYGTVETRISLGSDFESGKTYTVVVNDVKETFVAQ